jgi:hypothetical protein
MRAWVRITPGEESQYLLQVEVHPSESSARRAAKKHGGGLVVEMDLECLSSRNGTTSIHERRRLDSFPWGRDNIEANIVIVTGRAQTGWVADVKEAITSQPKARRPRGAGSTLWDGKRDIRVE